MQRGLASSQGHHCGESCKGDQGGHIRRWRPLRGALVGREQIPLHSGLQHWGSDKNFVSTSFRIRLTKVILLECQQNRRFNIQIKWLTFMMRRRVQRIKMKKGLLIWELEERTFRYWPKEQFAILKYTNLKWQRWNYRKIYEGILRNTRII